MFNGIKPTHLWHLTSKKYFRMLIMDRICTRPPHEQRARHDQIKFVGIILASALGVMASFGLMSPPRKLSEVRKCDTSKSTCKPPKVPCPPKEEKPMRSCPPD